MQKADALATQSAVSPDQAPLDAAAVAAEGRRLTAVIPLPPGGTLDDAGFATSTGGAPLADVHFVAQFNAMCDWYRHALASSPSASTLHVINSIPSWSQFRGGPAAVAAQGVAKALSAGDPGALKEQVRLNCSGFLPEQQQQQPKQTPPSS